MTMTDWLYGEKEHTWGAWEMDRNVEIEEYNYNDDNGNEYRLIGWMLNDGNNDWSQLRRWGTGKVDEAERVVQNERSTDKRKMRKK